MKRRLKNDVDVSFGIPCYNSANTLLDLLRCFEPSEKITYEIIILDDGSTDNTIDLCKKFAHKNNKLNLKIYSTENGGVSKARNKIISLASGEWLSFIDSDDLIDFKKYEEIILDKLDPKYDLLICSKKKNNNLKPILPQLISKEIINSPWAKFYKLDILRKNKVLFSSDFDLGEDLLFNLSYYTRIKNVKLINNCPYRYITENSYLTKKNREDKYEILMRLNDECKKIIINFADSDLKSLKALEYIRIKNLIHCLKTCSKEGINECVSKINNDDSKEYLILNSLKETLVYYAWYLIPKKIILRIIRGQM